MARNFIDAWEIYDTHAYDYWNMLQSKDSERSAKYIHLGQKLKILTLYSKGKNSVVWDKCECSGVSKKAIGGNFWPRT